MARWVFVTDGQTDICDSRVAFATANIINTTTTLILNPLPLLCSIQYIYNIITNEYMFQLYLFKYQSLISYVWPEMRIVLCLIDNNNTTISTFITFMVRKD